MSPSAVGPGENTPLLLPTQSNMSSPQTEGTLEGGTPNDAARIRRIVRKIDWRLIPLLFFTYMLNFMDKTILSSASVFGLIDDTVRPPPSIHSIIFHTDTEG